MPKYELLPGVTSGGCPPRVVCDARATIRRARRRAILRDVLQISLVIAVDTLFMRWPDSRFPFLDRGHSMSLLGGVNVFLVAELWLSRTLPKWWAGRVAETWSRRERDRFKA